MDIDDLTDADRKALAKDLAAELDTGLYGNRAVLSRRQLLTLAGGSAGVAGLVALGVDPATAQSAAGQVGTESSPEDVFAYNLDVQGALQRDLDAGGQAIKNAGSVSTDSLSLTAAYSGTVSVPSGGSVSVSLDAVVEASPGYIVQYSITEDTRGFEIDYKITNPAGVVNLVFTEVGSPGSSVQVEYSVFKIEG